MRLLYQDSQLDDEDIASLEPTGWLTDNVIAFSQDFLQHETYAAFPEILFVSPPTVQLIAFVGATELPQILSPLNIPTRKLILLPLNDNTSDKVGGSHWCLLAWSTESGFKCYDSAPSQGMLQKAIQIARTLVEAFPQFHQPGIPVTVETGPRVLQTNGYDCGVYTICWSETLAAEYVRSLSAAEQITSARVTQRREQLKALITHLADK